MCGEEFRTVPGTERRVSTGAAATGTDATGLLDDGGPLSCPTADPDIPEVLFCSDLCCSAGVGAGAFSRMNLHHLSISPVYRAQALEATEVWGR
jgi:hypothetical protein